MSLAITHFLLGAIISLGIFRYIFKNQENIILHIYIAFIGGFWAMIPDMHKLYDAFGHSFKGYMCNIFFFHCVLDDLDFLDGVTIPLILIMILLLFILVVSPKLEDKI
jgi:hypothetical protein